MPNRYPTFEQLGHKSRDKIPKTENFKKYAFPSRQQSFQETKPNIGFDVVVLVKNFFSSAPLLQQIPRKLVFYILRITDLIFQCGRHEERKNLVKQRPSTKFTGLVCYLSQGCFPHRRGTIFDLQQQFHDLSLFQLFWTQSAFINIHLKRKKTR